MKLVARLAVLVYATSFLFLGCLIGLFALRFIPLLEVIQTLSAFYTDNQLRLILGISACIILTINYIFSRSISGEEQKGKVIAFDNPSGRVSVSLNALEDLVRRVIARVQEVKDVRCSITASKKKLSVNARLVLNSEVNIPEMTSQLQELVKNRIQDTIGIEEIVVVRIHVVKMIPAPTKVKKKEKKEVDGSSVETETSVPFQGYRA